ncbi:hypothetical protein J2T07_001756 [Luteibacter jiangsuensis]|uniref:Ribosomally synthesized peptide with nif11-like leader n=1 Tax=Luteibacter jiangsuensis TaxID=637577 RepID=A0ABT9SYE2_9GAMM|nr:hypothetical protein [Luteibacter jiangsuensis]MDQ0009579.1 hypothetical protein [Luteibacter jiangsuensis]
MSDVIDFLERMGGNAALNDAGTAELARELDAAAVDGALAAAILAGDEGALRDRIAPGTFYSIQLGDTPQNEEGSEPPANDAPETPDVPDPSDA